MLVWRGISASPKLLKWAINNWELRDFWGLGKPTVSYKERQKLRATHQIPEMQEYHDWKDSVIAQKVQIAQITMEEEDGDIQ